MSGSGHRPLGWLRRFFVRDRTLRARLTVGMVVVLLAACAVLGVASELFLREFLLARLDGQLVAAGGRYSASLEHDHQPDTGRTGRGESPIPGQAAGTLGIRLIAGRVTDAAVVTDSGASRPVRLGTANVDAVRAVRPGSDPTSVDLAGVGDYRLRAVQGHDGDVQVTGLPLHPLNDTLARLFVVLLVVFGIVVVLGGAATALVVRRMLRPLQRLSVTALRVSELALTGPEAPLPTTGATGESGSEVDQVSIAFDRMLERVSQAMASRDATEDQLRQFVADASHELRTPLATIRAYAEYGASPETGTVPTETADALERITVTADRMGALVADLLLLARLDAGRPMAREAVDVTRLVLEAVADARAAAPGHRWRLDLPERAVTAAGDADRIHQVVANLLTNAHAHTPAGTTVTAAVRQDSLSVEVAIRDDGPGIPRAQLPGLFDRFSRGDTSRSRAHGSTGLGLAIAHSIAVAHGGSLTVVSADSDGTCFRLRLPHYRPVGRTVPS
jgi:two-component system OmpR family sensor kinase